MDDSGPVKKNVAGRRDFRPVERRRDGKAASRKRIGLVIKDRLPTCTRVEDILVLCILVELGPDALTDVERLLAARMLVHLDTSDVARAALAFTDSATALATSLEPYLTPSLAERADRHKTLAVFLKAALVVKPCRSGCECHRIRELCERWLSTTHTIPTGRARENFLLSRRCGDLSPAATLIRNQLRGERDVEAIKAAAARG